MFSDDCEDDVEIEAGVFVHGHVAEADHVLHAGGYVGGKNPCGLEQRKGVATFLRQAQSAPADDVHSKIDARLAGSL